MTQVITVSAHTAAYASDAVRKPQRTDRKTYVEENMRSTAPKDGDGGTGETLEITAVQASALSLGMLDTGQPRNYETTLKQALKAYKENGK
ncbi:hypothetical protein [Rhizobium halophytocola]|uniref:Uncharacterized protein n=1 Tax=Rhizobium halophytocola TaxID=735519 RepID=A0ABS4DZI0_9HYPH|nr:hypothetical protein [Rhizobium halophytocola]MBP1851091.1 hypothetical protein [Rhizobium halophytocola]